MRIAAPERLVKAALRSGGLLNTIRNRKPGFSSLDTHGPMTRTGSEIRGAAARPDKTAAPSRGRS